MKVFFLLVLLLIIIILNIYLSNKKINKKVLNIDNFISINNDPAYDGKMQYKFLTNSDYTKNILNKYYVNDDTKINNKRVINHPYQNKTGLFFGNPRFALNNTFISNNIYNRYGIRV